MLVLSRKIGEKIFIGTPQGDVWLTVLANDQGVVRLGVEGPREVQVLREELVVRRMCDVARSELGSDGAA